MTLVSKIDAPRGKHGKIFLLFYIDGNRCSDINLLRSIHLALCIDKVVSHAPKEVLSDNFQRMHGIMGKTTDQTRGQSPPDHVRFHSNVAHSRCQSAVSLKSLQHFSYLFAADCLAENPQSPLITLHLQAEQGYNKARSGKE